VGERLIVYNARCHDSIHTVTVLTLPTLFIIRFLPYELFSIEADYLRAYRAAGVAKYPNLIFAQGFDSFLLQLERFLLTSLVVQVEKSVRCVCLFAGNNF